MWISRGWLGVPLPLIRTPDLYTETEIFAPVACVTRVLSALGTEEGLGYVYLPERWGLRPYLV